MADLITIGLSKIEIGEIASDGGMGEPLEQIGYTAEGTATIETEDPEVTEFFVEEIETPIYQSSRMGRTTISFALASPDLAQCQKVFGGEAPTGTGGDLTWNYPSGTVVLEKSIKITPKEGIVFEIPRGRISAKFAGSFGRADTLKVEVSVSVLQPKKAGTPPMILSLVGA